MTLTPNFEKTIEIFLHEEKIVDLYKSYEWKNDTYQTNFSDLFELEKEAISAAKANFFKLYLLKKIGTWGNHPDSESISCEDPLNIIFYSNNSPVPWLKKDPVKAIRIIEANVNGYGPTFSSKLLHFAVPQIFGALDTRLVRVFGKNSEDIKKYQLLDLKVNRPKKGRPSINVTKSVWPKEYGTWVGILNNFADYLNQNNIICPHPEPYVQKGLRVKNQWLPADVETALFSYASHVIKENKKRSKTHSRCIH